MLDVLQRFRVYDELRRRTFSRWPHLSEREERLRHYEQRLDETYRAIARKLIDDTEAELETKLHERQIAKLRQIDDAIPGALAWKSLMQAEQELHHGHQRGSVGGPQNYPGLDELLRAYSSNIVPSKSNKRSTSRPKERPKRPKKQPKAGDKLSTTENELLDALRISGRARKSKHLAEDIGITSEDHVRCLASNIYKKRPGTLKHTNGKGYWLSQWGSSNGPKKK